jgi:hypothetical protein
MRSLLPPILALAVAIFAGCEREPYFRFADQVQIAFTNRYLNVGEGLVLGPSSRASFVQTISQPESDFAPSWLEKSALMGVFQAGDTQFEYHLDLVVHRGRSRIHIWKSDFSRQLEDALVRTNSTWKEMLER